MTRTFRTTLLLSVLLGPAAALAQAAADKPADAQPGPADAAKPLEAAPAPAAAPALPPVLTKLNLTLYGYVNLDAMYDTTRSYVESMVSGAVARKNTQDGDHGRWVLTARNTRFGFRVAAPEYHQIKATALVEGDFDQTYSGASEAITYPQGFFRLRQAHLRMETPWIDVLIGQTTYLFGWQASFYACAATPLGLPGEPFGRTPQVRLTKVLKSAPLNVEVAAGAFRPPQRNTDLPEFQGGLRFLVNNFKGTHSFGAAGTTAVPAALGVSGAYRQFRAGMNSTATPVPAAYPEKKVDGYGLSVDAMLPLIPSRNGSRGNTLTAYGTYAITKGAGDILSGVTGFGTTAAGAAVRSASAAAPAGMSFIEPDVGTIAFDGEQKPHAVNWNGAVVGAEYYLPPSGRIFVSANYSVATSDNVNRWAPAASQSGIFYRLQNWDVDLYADVTPEVRLVFAWEHRQARYGDGMLAKNERYHLSAFYFF